MPQQTKQAPKLKVYTKRNLTQTRLPMLIKLKLAGVSAGATVYTDIDAVSAVNAAGLNLAAGATFTAQEYL